MDRNAGRQKRHQYTHRLSCQQGSPTIIYYRAGQPAFNQPSNMGLSSASKLTILSRIETRASTAPSDKLNPPGTGRVSGRTNSRHVWLSRHDLANHFARLYLRSPFSNHNAIHINSFDPEQTLDSRSTSYVPLVIVYIRRCMRITLSAIAYSTAYSSLKTKRLSAGYHSALGAHLLCPEIVNPTPIPTCSQSAHKFGGNHLLSI